MLIQELLNTVPQSKLSEDWGSSDWYAALSYMARDIKAGATEEEAAEAAAEFYHDHMGDDGVQDAADHILNRWKSLPKERKEKFLSNLREGIDRYDDPETGDWWDDDGNHGNTKTGEQYHMGKRVMPSGAARYRARTSGVGTPAGKKIYHKVPFARKDDAKAEGMRWDPEKKMWYHTSAEKSKSSAFKKNTVNENLNIIQEKQLAFAEIFNIDSVKDGKAEFVNLLKNWAQNAEREHAAYMKRSTGGTRDWHATRNFYANTADEIKAEFQKKFAKRPSSKLPKYDAISYFDRGQNTPLKFWQLVVA